MKEKKLLGKTIPGRGGSYLMGETHSLTVCTWRGKLFDERDQTNMTEEVLT